MLTTTTMRYQNLEAEYVEQTEKQLQDEYEELLETEEVGL